MLDVLLKHSPESASSSGLEKGDPNIGDLSAAAWSHERRDLESAVAELTKRRAAEKDPNVRQDLDILIAEAKDEIRQGDIREKYFLPYLSAAKLAFFGARGLLDDQVAPARRANAVVRLRKYAGLENGFRPAVTVVEETYRQRLKEDPKRLGPFKEEVEQDLAQEKFYLDGIESLCKKYKVEGWQAPLAKLREQSAGYQKFIRTEVLPHARTDFRLPAEVYAARLFNYGIDIPPAELAQMAHAAFAEYQKEMQALAPKVAAQLGIKDTDYRAVIRELKKKQIVGEAILPHYKTRLKQIEDIVRKENLVTLPGRESRIRLATAAESAAQPAPHMVPPRLVGNTGESGEFVLPLRIPNASGKEEAYDDFTFAAASWTLTAHEARPGHEMQFAALVEKGVSTARALYAFNSTNVEGWGLYSEWMMKPFMPAEGQLISLQHRMMRAARAFIDPELQSGKLTAAEGKRILLQDVMLSEAMARQEIERYTFRAPGQATSYFYGFTRMLALRKDVEKRIGAGFSEKKFHDFVLAQGLLPPHLLRRAVMEQFTAQ